MKDRIQPSLVAVSRAIFEEGTFSVEVKGMRTAEDPEGEVTIIAFKTDTGLHTVSVMPTGKENVLMAASGRTPANAVGALFVGRSALRRTVFSHVGESLETK